MAILAVNAGSSSLKFSLHPLNDGDIGPAALTGVIEGLEPQGVPRMRWSDGAGRHERALPAGDGEPFARALAALRAWLQESGLPAPQAVAHRVVHGGAEFSASVFVDEAVLERLQRFNSLAPLHQPHNLAGVRAFMEAFAGVPQLACFDTAYHADAPALHQAFALPYTLTVQGVRRYGFHGLSYQYIIGELLARSERARGRTLMAHLGNGASLCAAIDGHSIASTMGFSALDGLMMGSRCGALDPGVLLYLMEQGWSHAQIERLLYKDSGLLGVSGVSADMRTLRADGSADAQRAIALFTHRVVRESGALVACLQGLDLLAFSGGIGEHDAALRGDVCVALGWLGVRIDAAANAAADGNATVAIHAPDSAVEVWVVPTDEGRVAAREAAALLKGGG